MLTAPGQMQLTVIPRLASSTASDRVKPMMPVLLAVYALMPLVAPSASVEAILTMRPAPLWVRWGRHARTSCTCAVITTAKVRAQCWSKSGSSNVDSNTIPALFTRISRPDQRCTISSTTICRRAASDTSNAQPCALPPAAVISATTVLTLARSRSITATCAPSSANRCAVARPMPLAAPVTSATLPLILRLSFDRRGIGFS